jgi:hypothetical protein
MSVATSQFFSDNRSQINLNLAALSISQFHEFGPNKNDYISLGN